MSNEIANITQGVNLNVNVDSEGTINIYLAEILSQLAGMKQELTKRVKEGGVRRKQVEEEIKTAANAVAVLHAKKFDPIIEGFKAAGFLDYVIEATGSIASADRHTRQLQVMVSVSLMLKDDRHNRLVLSLKSEPVPLTDEIKNLIAEENDLAAKLVSMAADIQKIKDEQDNAPLLMIQARAIVAKRALSQTDSGLKLMDDISDGIKKMLSEFTSSLSSLRIGIDNK